MQWQWCPLGLCGAQVDALAPRTPALQLTPLSGLGTEVKASQAPSLPPTITTGPLFPLAPEEMLVGT